MNSTDPSHNNINSTLPIYSIGLLLSLYLAQGLPVGFLTQALPAILRQNEVSLTAIGGFGLLMAPWALKFLWAPVVDHYYSRRIGQSRSWILPTQLLTVVILLALSWVEPTDLSNHGTLLLFFTLLFLLNLFGATQDIATDGLAVRMLPKAQQHVGNAMQVVGSRLGFIFGGGAVLLLLAVWSWQMVFVLLAGFVLLNSLPIFAYKEPVWRHDEPQHSTLNQVDKSRSWRTFFKTEFAYFWHSREMRAWLLVLLTFKLGDSLGGAMVKPMMVDMGFSLAKIGLWASMLGSVASLLGALVAALLMKHMQRSTALWSFNVFQVVTFALYAALAWQYEHGQQVVAWQVYGVNAIEHVAGAMALVTMLTIIMDYSRKKQAGSDFTFQVSILALVGGSVHIMSGALADWLGYSIHFTFCALLAVGCLLPMMYWRRVM